MVWQSVRVAGVAAMVAVSAGSVGVAREESGFVRITPAEIQWRDIPDSHGAQEAVLLGDAEKPGMYKERTCIDNGSSLSRGFIWWVFNKPGTGIT
jgi:hypothetical protein